METRKEIPIFFTIDDGYALKCGNKINDSKCFKGV